MPAMRTLNAVSFPDEIQKLLQCEPGDQVLARTDDFGRVVLERRQVTFRNLRGAMTRLIEESIAS